MKEIRIQFHEEEYHKLNKEANDLGILLKELVHIRAQGIFAEDTPMCRTKLLCNEMAKCRETLNKIIRREANAERRLFEDDLISMELAMSYLEKIVTEFVKKQFKEARRNGNIDV